MFLNMIPARDLEENRHFSQADQAWFRKWIDWTAQHREYLLNTRTILHQPGIGAVDGTSAIKGGAGWLFLFNPNAKRLPASFKLDDSIGLTEGATYVLREHYPQDGRNIGLWKRGETVSLTLDGTSATVLEILPDSKTPLVLGATGEIRVANGALELTGVTGEAGTEQDIEVRLPAGAKITAVRLNGQAARFTAAGDTIKVPVRFEGEPFARSRQVLDNRFTIPERIFRQLRERKQQWPIPWTAEDLRCTWLAPNASSSSSRSPSQSTTCPYR